MAKETFIQVRDGNERTLYNGTRLFSLQIEFEFPDGLLESWGLVMNRLLGVTSVTGSRSSSLTSFSLRSALLDIGELGRGNIEELPRLLQPSAQLYTNGNCMTHGFAVSNGSPGMRVHGLDTNLESS